MGTGQLTAWVGSLPYSALLFLLFFHSCLEADESYDFAGVTEVKNSGKSLYTVKVRDCVLHERVDQFIGIPI